MGINVDVGVRDLFQRVIADGRVDEGEKAELRKAAESPENDVHRNALTMLARGPAKATTIDMLVDKVDGRGNQSWASAVTRTVAADGILNDREVRALNVLLEKPDFSTEFDKDIRLQVLQTLRLPRANGSQPIPRADTTPLDAKGQRHGVVVDMQKPNALARFNEDWAETCVHTAKFEHGKQVGPDVYVNSLGRTLSVARQPDGSIKAYGNNGRFAVTTELDNQGRLIKRTESRGNIVFLTRPNGEDSDSYTREFRLGGVLIERSALSVSKPEDILVTESITYFDANGTEKGIVEFTRDFMVTTGDTPFPARNPSEGDPRSSY